MTALAIPLHQVTGPGRPIDYTPPNYATVIWAIWIASFGGFEGYALASGHPENTLSAQVWRLAHVVADQPMSQWSPEHWAFAVLFLGLVLWLTLHFDFGLIR